MATNLSSHVPITMYETISGNTELTQMPPEAAGQTFPIGAPVELNASGYLEVWDGATIAGKIYGVSLDFGHNLGTAGESYPANFGQVGFPGSNINILTPPNQPGAVTIPYGAPFIMGGTLTMLNVQDTIFKAQTDSSAASPGTITPAIANVGQQFGLTVDANGTWYIDFNKTTPGTNTVLTVIGLYPGDVLQSSPFTEVPNGQLLFQFLPASAQV